MSEPALEGTPQATGEQVPPWGDEANFDAARAWELIQNLRADKDKLAARPVLTDDAKAKLAEYERLEQASKTELERANEELSRWQSEAERWRKASVSSQIKALAAPQFADPDDAVHALDATKYLGAGGDIDEKAIQADLAELLERKPHYRKSDAPAGPRTPAPNRAQGAPPGTPADPAQQFAAFLQGQLTK